MPCYHATMVDVQALTIRLPADLYEALRRRAFEQHVSQQSVITEALRAYLATREASK